MSNLRTAAQQALEFLDAEFGWSPGEAPRIDALRSALAQQAEPVLVQGELPPRYVARSPIQAEPVEPVAWIDALKDAFFEGFTSVATYNDTLLNSPEEAWENYKPPRPAPPQRKPLTEEEIVDAVREADLDWQKGWTLDETQSNRFVTLARAVERAHGIKE